MKDGAPVLVAGAAQLAEVRDAVVVDIGGTTTDTAVVRDGQVEMCDEGASIGGWRTHIKALKLAVDAAVTVLRVDQIIMAKPAGGPKMPQGNPQYDA